MAFGLAVVFSFAAIGAGHSAYTHGLSLANLFYGAIAGILVFCVPILVFAILMAICSKRVR
ncbi:hypothetical protein KIF53_09380 [Chromobacterium subtsugae]|uniref:Uncharacterized protein n=1 Tax=Chromobacterium subtsugae TaxID=251747 RepID=A0ABS7FCN5_9NEIS|nr:MULTISPECIES: hypothetical protein [Chromobacterium]KUM04213.1 hypothetical protein Cv017_15790 [Chromobacterium subtsugae]KZE85186.1 hypothetical protein AWB61_20695 [Chromobacterium sp. F49]MBW7566307.1 hypothetical protein [Chromobacterium subtsugae]MBW8287834.1 hypothetical protein [Chromobacterium subtsugae]WSE91163.1 hypothetical protein U6115_20165 [Chromobacterium subtsugae]